MVGLYSTAPHKEVCLCSNSGKEHPERDPRHLSPFMLNYEFTQMQRSKHSSKNCRKNKHPAANPCKRLYLSYTAQHWDQTLRTWGENNVDNCAFKRAWKPGNWPNCKYTLARQRPRKGTERYIALGGNEESKNGIWNTMIRRNQESWGIWGCSELLV